MGWSPVYFGRLYYTVAGGTEYELTANSLTIPPVINYSYIQVSSWLASLTSNNLSNTGASVRRNNGGDGVAEFQYLYGYNGGRGTFNLWYFWNQMSIGQDILIYKESGNPNIALVFRKKANYQFEVLTKWYSTYTSEITSMQMTSTNAAGNTYSYLIDTNAYNLGFVTDGSNYRLCYTQITGRVGDSRYYDQNFYYYNVAVWRQGISNLLQYLLYGNTPPPPPATDEPYGGDDYDESLGGDGDHDDTSDTISQSAIPVAAATRTGMCTAYVPTWGEIQSVADALLDPNIFQILAQNVVKLSDVVIGLSVFPCVIPATNTGTVKANVLGVEIGTGVVCHIADDQYVEFDCGSLAIEEYWGNCLDYNPYTRISIFLPFCGMYELDTDEVMGRTLNVSYRVDIFSGACLATIKIDGSVFYQYSGQCSSQVPLSSVSFDSFLSSMLDIGVATATGISGAAAAGSAVTRAEKKFSPDVKKGNMNDLMQAQQNYSAVKEQSGNAIADAAVGAVIGSKGFYQHAGAMSGSPGFLGVRYPYLIIKRPEQVIPRMYGKYHGFPTNTSAVLGDLTGYTEINDIRLNIPDATVDEIIECEQLLKGGVVI